MTQSANGTPQEATDYQLQDAELRLHAKRVKAGSVKPAGRHIILYGPHTGFILNTERSRLTN